MTNKAIPASMVINSAAGKVSHSPVIFPRYDRIKAIGIFKIKPLKRATVMDGFAWSVEEK